MIQRYTRCLWVCLAMLLTGLSQILSAQCTTLAAGTYTINSALPTAGTNYQTFNAAATALACGISGPVVFNVVPGTYKGSVTFNAVPGASAANTVTINGNGDTLIAGVGSLSANRAAVVLDGARYYVFDSLVVNVSDSTYGAGFRFTNGSDYNVVRRSKIILNPTTVSSGNNGIVFSSSPSSTTGTGNNGNYNYFLRNTTIGGYAGATVYGGSSTVVRGNRFENNSFQDFYTYGVYTGYSDSTVYRGNDITRLTRTSYTTGYGFYFTTGTVGNIVDKNTIHDLNAAGNSAVYGFYYFSVGLATAPTKLTNNIVYNMSSASTNVQYGIYVSTGGNISIFHNTFVLENLNATTSSAYGMYLTGVITNLDFRNNTVYVRRSGTSGNKYAIYVLNPPVSGTVDYNDYYITSTSGNASIIGFYSPTSYTTLAQWQTATGFDLHSQDVDPQFTDIPTGNLYPNNPAIISSGTGVGITTDILGNPRDLNVPEPGAFEVAPVVGRDVGAESLISPVALTCYGTPQVVKIVVRNYSSAALNTATFPVTVTGSASGPNPVTFTPVVVNNRTIPAGDTIHVILSSSYNMSAAGVYVFNASATVANDVLPSNNALTATSRTSIALSAGVLSSSSPSYCVTGGTPTLTLSQTAGASSVQWQQAPDLTGPWTNVGTGSNTYTPAAALTDTMFYRAIASCGTNRDTANLRVTVDNPVLVSTTPGTRCGTGTVTLSATAAPNNGIRWYDAATGGNAVGTGNSFTTPVLTATKNYWASAFTAGTASTSLADIFVYPGTPATNSTLTAGLEFNVTGSVLNIYSVDIYPTAAIGTPFKIVIRQGGATGTPILTFQDTVRVTGTATNPQKQTVPVNFAVPQGTGYYMTFFGGAMTAPYTGTAVYPGALRTYVSSGITQFPFIVPGSVTITTSSLGNNYLYYFYNWIVSSYCETPRQQVAATLTAGPTFSLSPFSTVCNNAITPLTVTSPAANFNNYTWSPVTNLYTDAAATIPYTGGNASTVYLKSTTSGLTKYYATAMNTTTNCGGYDSVTVNILPGNVAINATPDVICTSGTTTLSLNPLAGYAGGSLAWASSLNGVSYVALTGITGAVYTTPVLTDTAYYRVQIRNSAGAVCQTLFDTINVVSPTLLTSTPGSRCNPGSVTLNATAQGGTVAWYDAPIGGNLVATGNSFTTPSLNATKTYYVTATVGGATPQLVGYDSLKNVTGTVAVNSSFTAGMEFDVLAGSTTIQTVDIYPTTAIGTNFQIAIRPTATGTPIMIYQGVTTVQGSTTNPIAQQVPVNFTLTPGSYVMTFFNGALNAPATGNAVYPGALRNFQTNGLPYPFTIPAVISQTGSTGGDTYVYYFYNWKISTACSAPRVAVDASIFPTTDVTTQPQSINTCASANIILSINAVGGNLTYQWRKNGVNIPNTNNDTLIINPAQASDNGNYDVIVYGFCGNDTSSVAAVNVSATNTWTGTVSQDWNTAGNWCGAVPDSNTNVVIPSGTPYAPRLTSTGAVRNISISSGATLTVTNSGTLNIYGDWANNGTFAGSTGGVAFRGVNAKSIGALTAGRVEMNSTGAVTLTGNLTPVFSLTLTNGNIFLGSNSVILSGTTSGSVGSHLVTNGTGSVVSNAITTNPVVVPVGPDAATYNPVTITNGGGLNYNVRVAIGVNPAITNTARAINRTWYIQPTGQPNGPATISVQYADALGNASSAPSGIQDVGVHNGTQWVKVSGTGVTPTGTATARIVTFQTSTFGNVVLTTPGGIDFPTAVSNLDPSITGVRLLPNLVKDRAILEVTTTRSGSAEFYIVDAAGKSVMVKKASLIRGVNRIEIVAAGLAAGVYQILGTTPNGTTETVRFIKE